MTDATIRIMQLLAVIACVAIPVGLGYWAEARRGWDD